MKKSVLLEAAQAALALEGSSKSSDVSIVIGNDALLQRLNLQYRQTGTPTDVLSFAAGEIDPDTDDMYLGDVVISLPRAIEQANTEGHQAAEELQLLVVHGILHLLGYDHEGFTDKQRMQTAQDRIMEQLGVHVNSTL